MRWTIRWRDPESRRDLVCRNLSTVEATDLSLRLAGQGIGFDAQQQAVAA